MSFETFRRPPQAPPLFNHTPQSVREAVDAIVRRSTGVQDSIVTGVTIETATFDSVNVPIARTNDAVNLEARILAFYQAVSSDAELRNASIEAYKKLADLRIESSTRQDMFALVNTVFEKQKDDVGLDAESRRLLETTHKDYIRMGLGIPAGPSRERFKHIQKRLSQLCIDFQRNLNEEHGGLWLTAAELEGLPEDVSGILEKGRDEHDGKLFLTFKYPDLFPAFKYCKNSNIRRKIYIANDNKCNQNVQLFDEIVVLRKEAAQLLGYPDHATFRLTEKMAKTPVRVNSFLDELRARLKPAGMRELENLRKLKKSVTGRVVQIRVHKVLVMNLFRTRSEQMVLNRALAWL